MNPPAAAGAETGRNFVVRQRAPGGTTAASEREGMPARCMLPLVANPHRLRPIAVNTRPSILVVDDDPRLLASLKALLELEGCEVATARHGREALEFLEQRRPDMVLLDLMMPVMDGRQFLQALQQRQERDPSLASLPVTVVTALDQTGDLKMRYGCAVMRKPIDPDELLRAVRRQTAH
jgi:CheY-like chemotaxis protein